MPKKEQATALTHVREADVTAARSEWEGRSIEQIDKEWGRLDSLMTPLAATIREQGQDTPAEKVEEFLKMSGTMAALTALKSEKEDAQEMLDAALKAHEERQKPVDPLKPVPQKAENNLYAGEVGALSSIGLPKVEAHKARHGGGAEAFQMETLNFEVQDIFPSILNIGTGDIVTPRPDSGEITAVYRRPPEVMDLFRSVSVPSDTSAYYYRKQTSASASAAARTEEANFSASDYDVGRTTEPIRSIGHIATVSNELLADGGQELRDFLDFDMLDAVRAQVELQLMNGSGTAPNLDGLLGRTGVTSQDLTESGNDLTAPVKDTALGITNLYSQAGVMATHLLAHPTFVQALMVDENAQGGSFYLGDAGAGFRMMIWGAQIVMCGAGLVTTATHAADTIHAILGAWNRRYIRFVERQGMLIQIGTNADDFQKNRASIRAHVRIGLATPRADAFHQLVRA